MACTSRSRKIRYSSPRISTSKPVSGENSTRSETSMVRTVGPAATTSAARAPSASSITNVAAMSDVELADYDQLVRELKALMPEEAPKVIEGIIT